MSMDDKYSDEKLNLFIDGELDSRDRAEIMEAIQNDGTLSDRASELMRLKDAVHLAYSNPPEPGSAQSDWRRDMRSGWLRNAVAAMLLLAVGMAGGWLLHPLTYNTAPQPAIATSTVDQQEQIILHISKSDPRQFAAALDYAEKFLEENDGNDQIDVVAHASGLDVMRADVSPMKARILSLMQKHENIHFIACAGAIRMFQQKNGVSPTIIEGVGTDMTAFDHIVDRLQSGGWKYIKVESLSET